MIFVLLQDVVFVVKKLEKFIDKPIENMYNS